MSVTGTRDRGSNWCAGPGPASARQQQPGQTIFYSSFIDLIWSWPSATTQPETAGIAAENMFTNTNLKSSKSSSFKCNSFLTVCDKLRSLGIATVAMQHLGTCPLLFLDIRHNRRIERERVSPLHVQIFYSSIIIHPDNKMWCDIVFVKYMTTTKTRTLALLLLIKVKF